MPREYTEKYKRKRIKEPKEFDKRSLRIKDVGRTGHTKIIVGCPKGAYSPITGRCRKGMKLQAILKQK